jgi:hypothetical protein
MLNAFVWCVYENARKSKIYVSKNKELAQKVIFQRNKESVRGKETAMCMESFAEFCGRGFQEIEERFFHHC